MDGGLRVKSPEPADCGSDISKDLLAVSGALIAAPFRQIGGVIGQLQIRIRASKEGDGQGRIAIGSQAIDDASHPGMHAKHLS